MSWIMSLMLAGMMVTSQSIFPIYTNQNIAASNSAQYVVVAPQVVLLDETERFEQTYPLNANGKVSVSNVNGSITIESWDKNEVKLEAVKTADSRENLNAVKIRIDAKPDYLRVETDFDSQRSRNDGNWKNRKLEVQYRLWVPRNAVLDEIETVNGSIIVSNMTNMTKVSTVNGEIRATNLRGTTNIETVNGTINADFDNLQNVSEIRLEAVNGETNLKLPSDAEATIKAETTNGNISNDFGLPVRKGKYVGRDLYGKLGSGAVKIHLGTVNGTTTIRRRQDGKSVSPVTNLLSANSDDDDDAVINGTINDAKINRQVAKAMRDSGKVSAEAMKEAAKEMKNAQKEIEKAQSIDYGKVINEAVVQSMADTIRSSTAIATSVMNEKMQADMKRQMESLKQRGFMLRNANLPAIESKSETFTVKSKPKVTINAQNCRVSVRGWDKSEVKYSIVKLARGGNQSPIQYTANHSDKEVNITVSEAEGTPNGMYFGSANQVRVEVFVPKKSNLRILTNQEIRVEGISGEVDLKGANEAVNVRDVDGKLIVSSDDGAIRVIGFSGEINSRTVEGTMSLEGDFQKLSASAVDGKIILTLPDNANATLQSNAEINASGFNLVKDASGAMLWRIGDGGANYNLQVDGGQIYLRRASELNAVN